MNSTEPKITTETRNCRLYDVGTRFISHFNTNSWGDEILIMEKKGKAFARVYWYYDDLKTIYLDWLTVSEDERKKGLGTHLQQIRENIGRRTGATTSCLWVEKNTWMHEWYKRRGYVDWKDNDNHENAVWMKKSL
jgi:GNAT superfamily N-acetyltransferase